MIITCVASGSKGNCYVLNEFGKMLILDCGQSVKWKEVQKACGFRMDNVDGVLYTHIHGDHFGHVKDFKSFGIECYGNSEVAEQDSSINMVTERRRRLIEGGWSIVPWDVPHTGSEGLKCACSAFYIESPSGGRVTYITDFLYSPFTFKSLNVEYMLIACNHDDDIEWDSASAKSIHTASGHSSLSTVKELVRVNKTDSLKQVILCHLSAVNATPEKMVSEVSEAAGPGVTVRIAEKHKVYIFSGRNL